MNSQENPDLAYIKELRTVLRLRDLVQEKAVQLGLKNERYAPEFELVISFLSFQGSLTMNISLIGVSGYLLWLLLKCQYFDNSQWN